MSYTSLDGIFSSVWALAALDIGRKGKAHSTGYQTTVEETLGNSFHIQTADQFKYVYEEDDEFPSVSL